MDSSILKRQNSYQQIVKDINAQIASQKEHLEALKNMLEMSTKTLQENFISLGMLPEDSPDIDELLADMPRQEHAHTLLPAILKDVFNQPEVSGFLSALPDNDETYILDKLLSQDTQSEVKSSIKGYVEDALGLGKNPKSSLLDWRNCIKADYAETRKNEKPTVIQNDALQGTTQIMPTKAFRAVNPVIRAIHRVVREYNEKYPFPPTEPPIL